MDSIREGGEKWTVSEKEERSEQYQRRRREVDSIREGGEKWTVSEKEWTALGHGEVGVGQYQGRN